jgi:two-component system chemotaxis response regulator CheY
LDSLSILIADDEAVSRLVLQRAIEQYGHRVLVATNGAEAWELFQRARPDVVVTDWIMPLVDGPELCQRIRAHPDSGYTYVILLTALGDKAHFLEGMEAGADDYLSKPFDPEELRARLTAAGRVLSLHRRLAQQNEELGALNTALAESARTDPLTGLGNRLRLWEDLQVAHSQVQRYGYQYAVALCDVDQFKAYNDRYGHVAGDEALRAVARAIAGQARSGDRAYRYGGEEFLVLLPAQAGFGAAIALNRIRQAVEALGITHEGNPPIGVLTISGGIAVTGDHVGDAQALVSQADAALYQAKEAGRNRIVVHQEPPAETKGP